MGFIKFVMSLVYRPRSILGLLIFFGIASLMIGGISIPFNSSVSDFFIILGFFLTAIGIAIWLMYIIPDIAKKW